MSRVRYREMFTRQLLYDFYFMTSFIVCIILASQHGPSGTGMIAFSCVNWIFVFICVVVMRQPYDYDPNERVRHKFMIQSVVMQPEHQIETVVSVA